MQVINFKSIENKSENLIIDCFAGGGGASVGIEMATGREVDIAINHDPGAIKMHMANHPDTLHLTEDIFKVDLVKYVAGRHVALMWSSPSCTHFSRARGGVPLSNQLRILPWSVYKHAKAIEPDVIIMENVPEIQTWGPLDENGQPIKERLGEEYNRFINAMKEIGYEIESKELVAADYGAPTIRKRWFAIFRKDGKPIVWPEASHDEYGFGNKARWIEAKSVIDCKNIGLSIHARKKPLAEKTMNRIHRGIDKFIYNNPNPCRTVVLNPTTKRKATAYQFIMEYYGQGVGSDLHAPLHTIVTKDRFALISAILKNGKVEDIFLRMLTPEELKMAQGFPSDYIINRDITWKPITAKDQVLRIGNSVCPIMAKVIVEANLPELKGVRKPNINVKETETGQMAFA